MASNLFAERLLRAWEQRKLTQGRDASVKDTSQQCLLPQPFVGKECDKRPLSEQLGGCIPPPTPSSSGVLVVDSSLPISDSNGLECDGRER